MTRRISALVVLIGGFTAVASACAISAPEISPATAASGLAVLAGAFLIIRARRAKE